MKCGKPYCVCVGQCFAQQSPLNDTSGGSMTTEAEELAEQVALQLDWLKLPQAAALLRRQAAEIERLHDYDTRLTAVMPADFKDWHENSRNEWPEIAAGVITSLREREDDAWREVERLKATPPDQREDLRCVIADLARQCQESDALLRQALEALDRASNSIGAFTSDEGSGEKDFDNLDTCIAVHTAIKQHLGEV